MTPPGILVAAGPSMSCEREKSKSYVVNLRVGGVDSDAEWCQILPLGDPALGR